MKIADLKPFMKKVDVTVKAVEKNEVREVESKLDDSSHKVTEALIGDDSASILLTLWDQGIEQVEEGKVYKISNGYTSLFKNSIRLNVGRYGSIKEVQDLIEANTENNLSEKILDTK